jgi:hypothetical protein
LSKVSGQLNPPTVDDVALIGNRAAIVRSQEQHQPGNLFRENHSLNCLYVQHDNFRLLPCESFNDRLADPGCSCHDDTNQKTAEDDDDDDDEDEKDSEMTPNRYRPEGPRAPKGHYHSAWGFNPRNHSPQAIRPERADAPLGEGGCDIHLTAI